MGEGVTRLERVIELLADGPMTRAEIAKALDIPIENTSGTIQQGIASGRIERVSRERPARFRLAQPPTVLPWPIV